jgi:protease I
MTTKSLQGMGVAILLMDGFEESELTEPRAALEAAGARTAVVAPRTGKIQAMRHDEKSIQIAVDVALTQADPRDFDAVLLPGGALNADALRVTPAAQEFIRQMDAAGKPIAVICHAPWLLVSAGLVRGRRLTSYHTIQDDLRNAGAEWEDRAIVRDRNWVSSRRPADLPDFNREMIALFAEQRAPRQPAPARS